ncbi:hypothetical protein QF037_005705 [Streptomyces canus]|nr:hypothetical protein [Streptomyces canus]MDQ0601360.1 hypothetical protein [Streptomyces canus]
MTPARGDAAPGWGPGGYPPDRHSMEKLVELGAKVELPGKALG